MSKDDTKECAAVEKFVKTASKHWIFRPGKLDLRQCHTKAGRKRFKLIPVRGRISGGGTCPSKFSYHGMVRLAFLRSTNLGQLGEICGCKPGTVGPTGKSQVCKYMVNGKIEHVTTSICSTYRRIVPTPRGTMLHPPRASKVPYNRNICFPNPGLVGAHLLFGMYCSFLPIGMAL